MSDGMEREFNVTEEFPLDKVGTTVTFVDDHGQSPLDVNDILEVNDDNLIIVKRKDLHFRINGKDYSLPPKEKEGVTKEGWSTILSIIREFIPQNLKQTFENCCKDDLESMLNADYKSLTANINNIEVPVHAEVETGLDLCEMNTIYTRYVNSCMIRILKRYATTLYSMCEKIWSAADDFCISAGYKWAPKTSTRKAINLEGLSKSEVAAVKAKNKILNPTTTQKKKRDVKEIKFRSVLIKADYVKYVNEALINDHLPKGEQRLANATPSTVPLYMIANFHSKLVEWNNSGAAGLHFTFPPFFVVDNESIWNLNTAKALVLYKEVSLTALKTLKMPMILLDDSVNPYNDMCLRITYGVDEIAEGTLNAMKETFRERVKRIVEKFKSSIAFEKEKQISSQLYTNYLIAQEQKEKEAEEDKRRAQEAAMNQFVEQGREQASAEQQSERIQSSLDDDDDDEWKSRATKLPKFKSRKTTKPSKSSNTKHPTRRGVQN